MIALVAAALFVLDRLALCAEAKGWIYWRRRSSTSSTAVFGAMNEILMTGDSHCVQVSQQYSNRVVEVQESAPPAPQGRIEPSDSD